MAREVSLLAAAAEAAAIRPQTAPQSVLNGKGLPATGAVADAILADTAHNRALEVMVLDLLKPMLSQWLDQNMPRLVAEALSEEVQRTRAAKGDAKKT
jgi:cell pole-organizing protein PopZ